MVVAVQVGAVADAQHVAVALVEPNPVGDSAVRAVAALHAAVDDVGHHAVARHAPRRLVVAVGRPLPCHHRVARRLGRLRRHPEPERRLEGDGGVRRHQVRVAQQVGADGLPRRAVVVVVGDLDGSPAVVLLAGGARPLRLGLAVCGGVAVVLLLEAVAPGVGAVGRRGPAAGGLVGRLRQEGGDLALAGVGVAGGGEVRVGVGGGDEGVVGVEALSGARLVVAVEQHLVEERGRYDGGDAAAATAGGRGRAAAAAAGALALAAGAAVIRGGAAPAVLAAAEAVGAERAAGLAAALLAAHGHHRHGHHRESESSHGGR
uniref:Uncharacterized protein n=1 Tax=Oryza nivara TaxID=4536 RepID=A0A0E0HVR1_ORYNI